MVRGVRRPLERMLAARGIDVRINTMCPSIWDLSHHAHSQWTYDKIAYEPWDFVFLQEQSNGIYEGAGYAAARQLSQAIRADGAQTAFFMTWRERGVDVTAYETLLGVPGGDFGYIPIALELDAPIAPVGWALRNALLNGVTIDFWKGGRGRHLNNLGRYLAASVLYAMLTGESPSGVYAAPWLDPAIAAQLDTIATLTVLRDPSDWNIR